MTRFGLALSAALVLAAHAPAANDGLAPAAADIVKPDMPDLDVEQKLGGQVPTDLELRDEVNYPIRLADAIGGKPTILVPAYYRCPQLCTQVLNGLVDAMRLLPMTAGEEFNVVTVSFDPKEKPPLAAMKKMSYVSEYGRLKNDKGWRFLTGDPSAKAAEEKIAALTNAIGYRFEYDKAKKLYKHASAIVVLTPEGKVSKYFFGVRYDPKDLRLALVEASGGKVGTLSDKVLLFCMDFDHATGKYTASVRKVMQAAGGVTVVVLLAALVFLFRRGPRPAPVV